MLLLSSALMLYNDRPMSISLLSRLSFARKTRSTVAVPTVASHVRRYVCDHRRSRAAIVTSDNDKDAPLQRVNEVHDDHVVLQRMLGRVLADGDVEYIDDVCRRGVDCRDEGRIGVAVATVWGNQMTPAEVAKKLPASLPKSLII